jgi:uncharacterized protein YbcI
MKTQNSPQPIPDLRAEPPRRAIRIAGSEGLLDSRETDAGATADGRQLLEISNAMVSLYKKAFGRGPTKARAQFAGHDTLLVSLESSLTVAERHLAAMGEHRRIREARLVLSDALEPQFRAIVEQALGRKTLAFMSGLDSARDMAVQIFTLAPTGDGSGPSPAQTDRRRAPISAVSLENPVG